MQNTKATVISFNSWPHIKQRPFSPATTPPPRRFFVSDFLSVSGFASSSFLWLHLGARNLVLWKVLLCLDILRFISLSPQQWLLKFRVDSRRLRLPVLRKRPDSCKANGIHEKLIRISSSPPGSLIVNVFVHSSVNSGCSRWGGLEEHFCCFWREPIVYEFKLNVVNNDIQ